MSLDEEIPPNATALGFTPIHPVKKKQIFPNIVWCKRGGGFTGTVNLDPGNYWLNVYARDGGDSLFKLNYLGIGLKGLRHKVDSISLIGLINTLKFKVINEKGKAIPSLITCHYKNRTSSVHGMGQIKLYCSEFPETIVVSSNNYIPQKLNQINLENTVTLISRF